MFPILALTGALLLSPPDTSLYGNWAALTMAQNRQTGQTVQLVAVIRFAPDSFRATLKSNDGSGEAGSLALTRGRWTTQKDPWGGNQLCVQIPAEPVHCQPYKVEGNVLHWGRLDFNRETDDQMRQMAPELLTGEQPGYRSS